MTSLGEQLKTARIEKGISLDEISLATNIQKRYLEHIEKDIPLNLPQTYFRAFIKSFALQVGLDPDELLRTTTEERKIAVTQSSPLETKSEKTEGQFPRQIPISVKQHQYRMLIILSSVLIVVLILSIIYLRLQRESPPVHEVSFSENTADQDHREAIKKADSVSRAQAHEQLPDSLTLEAVSVDTVWLHLLLDSVSIREYTLPPQHRLKWKAARSFLVTVGNAGSLFFTLNGIHLGTLGQGKTPLKNVLLTRNTLQQQKFSQQPTSHEKR
jgi:cytoskeletal protein RodZ